jgi:hypothetical protein
MEAMMNTITESNIDKLLEDISSIKTVINRNKPLLQRLLHPARLRLFFLLVGLNLIAICLVLFFLIQHYGFFAAIPKTGRIIIYAALAVDLVLIQIFKRKVFLSSARKIDPKLTLMGILREIFTFRIIHVYVPIVVLVILLGFYFGHHRIPYYIIPTISIGVGLLYNCIGSIIDIRQYLIFGYWTLVTGVLAILFTVVPALIVLAVSIGGGMLLMSLSGFFSQEINAEE